MMFAFASLSINNTTNVILSQGMIRSMRRLGSSASMDTLATSSAAYWRESLPFSTPSCRTLKLLEVALTTALVILRIHNRRPGVVDAELLFPATLYTIRRLLVSPIIATLLVVDIDHPRCGNVGRRTWPCYYLQHRTTAQRSNLGLRIDKGTCCSEGTKQSGPHPHNSGCCCCCCCCC